MILFLKTVHYQTLDQMIVTSNNSDIFRGSARICEKHSRQHKCPWKAGILLGKKRKTQSSIEPDMPRENKSISAHLSSVSQQISR